jgi:hypothetical protein
MLRITYRPSRTKKMNRLLNQEGIASIRSSLETCIRLSKYALPICALVDFPNGKKSFALYINSTSTEAPFAIVDRVSAELVFFPCIFVSRKQRLPKSRSFTLFFSFVDAFRTTLITLTT